MTDRTNLLPEKYEKELENIKARYPKAHSAIMPALYLAQKHFGLINNDAINWVSSRLSIPSVHVMEVATFYTMYYKKPVGKYHFQVCRTLSCAIRGAKFLSEHLKKRFQVEPREVTADGMWSFEEVECLGSCGSAPTCQINDTYFENLTPERLEEIILEIERIEPDLGLSTANDNLDHATKKDTEGL